MKPKGMEIEGSSAVVYVLASKSRMTVPYCAQSDQEKRISKSTRSEAKGREGHQHIGLCPLLSRRGI